MPYITSIEVLNHHKLPDLTIDLHREGVPFQHLVLTGPNGSGKTTLLRKLAHEVHIQSAVGHRSREEVARFLALKAQRDQGELPPESSGWLKLVPKMTDLFSGKSSDMGFQVFPCWTEETFASPFVSFFLEATRSLDVSPMRTPPGVFQAASSHEAGRQGPRLLEYLVHVHVQARLAEFEDKGSAESIFSWISSLENQLAELFDLPGLKMRFDRQNYNVFFEEPSGARYNLWELAAGHSAILDLLGELILRIDANNLARDQAEMSGVVLIDELEVHLHPELQEKILPFLTRTFPQLQFIVATHSPAVISSVDNAVVYDLERREGVSSAALRGTPYGQLMTSYFGLETDIDLASTEQLRRLEALWNKAPRDPEEEAELRRLAMTLAERSSQALALEIYNRMLSARLHLDTSKAKSNAQRL